MSRASADDRLLDGNPQNFERLYDQHADLAFSIALRICGSRERAEEALQEAFLAVWRWRDRFDPERGTVRSWLLGIVHHRAVDAVRHEHTRTRLDAGAAEVEQVASDHETDRRAVERLEAVRVRRALEQLPVEQRQIIELAYWGDLTQREIADALAIPLGTVKGRIRLGLQALRYHLDRTPSSRSSITG